MTLWLRGTALNPNHGARGPLEIGVKDTTRVLRDDDPRELLIRVKELLERYDPDVIISAWGDSFILPRLLEMSRRYRVPLPLNREATRAVQSRPARSYFSYGRIVYETASHSLFGRWHIDRENAFLIDDYGLDGTFELARITQGPVQQAARTSTGSAISAMEIADELCLSQYTVETHLKHIYDKLEIRSRTELTNFVRDLTGLPRRGA